MAFMPLLWLVSVFLRRFFGLSNMIFWSDELTILATFTGGGIFALLPVRLFHQFEAELVALKPHVAPLFDDLRRELHHRNGLVFFPLGLAALAIGIRYFNGDDFNPFAAGWFDYFYSVYLFLGFFFILNTTTLCARYTGIARVLGHEVAEGRLGRQEMRSLSRFYLKIAVIASFHFALCALSVYALYIIYTYSGNMWPGYRLIRFVQGVPLTRQLVNVTRDPLFGEVVIFFALYGSVSIAPIVYFIFPQWEVHRILVMRKECLLKKSRQMLEIAENSLGPNATGADLENYSRCVAILDSVEKIVEWPFEIGGKLGTIILIGIPSLLVLIKEVFLEAFLKFLIG